MKWEGSFEGYLSDPYWTPLKTQVHQFRHAIFFIVAISASSAKLTAITAVKQSDRPASGGGRS
ncbi:MAG: hypothetical protein WB869_07155 [Candidatus Acidiferrales bacterium]